MSPSLALAVLFVLIGAQVTRVMRPRHGPFLLLLVLAAAGVLGGELVAIGLKLGGPALGVLHPVPDAVAIGVFEGIGTAFAPARRRIP
ncbi:MAG: hypothetical protein JOY68_00795 [Candidatus Dormibacteraeota bacterium]|nr:hypothetical protein [Candidatus Dormibacteraeota bacterium]